MINTKRFALLTALLLCACSKSEGDLSSAELRSGPPPEGAPEVPVFEDVLAESGITFRHHFLDTETGTTYKINPYDHGSGVYAVDVNGDGLDDIYFLDFLGPNALYINKGGMRFEDVTQGSGVDVPRALSVGAAFGDFDGDGDADLYVTTYRGGNHLFRNKGDGTFDEITESSGTGYTGHSNSATWFDYDGDGDLDLYLCNIGVFTTGTISREANYFYRGEELPFSEVAKTPDRIVPGEADILYRNDGGGKFSDVTQAAGIASSEWNGDIAVADIDQDGDMDFYTSNMFGANHLYRNAGDGTFEDVTRSALGRTSWGGMGARFFDANGDAYPDLYVVDMHSDMWIDPKEGVKGWAPDKKFNTPLGANTGGGKAIAKPDDTEAKSVLFGNTFFVNNGDGTFTERSAEAGLENWWPWGITVGDYNNDGAEDVFVTAGMGFPFVYWPNHLYVGDGEGRFYEVGGSAGFEPPRLGETLEGAAIRGQDFTRSSRTAATADFDRDGDLDIVVNNFNHEPYLLRNETSHGSSAGNWVQLDLRLATRAPAIGARVVVKSGNESWHRWVTGAEGYLTQSSSVVHVGLGSAATIDSVSVYWPGSNQPQIVTSPATNERIEIVQE